MDLNDVWGDRRLPHCRLPRRILPPLLALGLALGSASCTLAPARPEAHSLNLHQQWQLQAGEAIAGHRISSSLGDIVLELDGAALHMPRAGRLVPLNSDLGLDCVLLSSPEIPAYQLRLCDLQRPRLGPQAAGAVIGRGDRVSLAMLRKQPEGTWAFVEPSAELIETLLTAP